MNHYSYLLISILMSPILAAFSKDINFYHFKGKVYAAALSHFGCNFDDDLYALSGDTDIFSDVRNKSVVFETEEEFNDFYNKVDKIRRDELNTMVYNTLDSFLTTFDEYIDSKNSAPNNTLSLSEFYNSYRPTYPLSVDDSISSLLRIYKKITKLNTKVEDSFVLASKDLDVDEEVTNALIKDHFSGALPAASFQHDQIVGLLRISVTKAKKEGFILIDMSEPKGPTPVVLQRQDRKHHKSSTQNIFINETFNHYKVNYVYNNEYIIVKTYPYREDVSRFSYVNVRTHLFYTPRSLCSFLQSSVKRSLFNPVRTIQKFESQGVLDAYVTLNVLEYIANLYTVYPLEKMKPSVNTKLLTTYPENHGTGIHVELIAVAQEMLSTSAEIYIAHVQLVLKFSGNILKDKIRRFYNIITSYTSESFQFSHDFEKIHRRLQTPVANPSKSKADPNNCIMCG